MLGYVGELTPAQAAAIKKHYRSCALPRAKELNVPCTGDRVGQTGVEKTYDKYLRGRSGEKLQRRQLVRREGRQRRWSPRSRQPARPSS